MHKNTIIQIGILVSCVLLQASAVFADIYDKCEMSIPTYMRGRSAPSSYAGEVTTTQVTEETALAKEQAEGVSEETAETTPPVSAESKKPKELRSRLMGEEKIQEKTTGSYEKKGSVDICRYLHPHSRIEVLYDDNIFNAQEVTRKKFDMVTVVDPGVTFMIGRKDKINVMLDGGIRYDTYYLNHYLNQVKPFYYGSGSVQMSNQYNILDVTYDIKRIPTWTSTYVQGGSNISSIVSSKAGVKWSYSRKSLSMDYSYAWKNYHYEQDTQKLYDYTLNDFGAVIYAKTKAMPRTEVLFEVDVQTQDAYKASPSVKYSDSSYSDLRLYIGTRGRITSKINGTLKIGYEMRHYYEMIAPDISNIRNDLTYSVQLNYLYSKKTSFYFSSYLNNIAGTSYIGRGMQRRYYYALWCKHFFSKPTCFIPRIYLMVDRFEVGGTAVTPGLLLELKYTPYKWIDVSLKYNYENRASDLNSNSYKNNIVSLGANMRF